MSDAGYAVETPRGGDDGYTASEKKTVGELLEGKDGEDEALPAAGCRS